MAFRNLIEAAQVSETGRSDLTPIRSLAAIADEKDAHFAFGRFDGRIRFARRNGIAFGKEQEVVNERLHVLFHGSPRGRRYLVVLHPHRARRHFVETLEDDAEALAELFHSAEVSIVAVPVDADGDVELDLVVCVVRLAFPHVPWDAGATEHDAGEGVV